MFYILAAVYAVMMLLGFALIKRPAGYVYSAETRIRRRDIMKKPVFWAIWLAFYLNITCGLALISQRRTSCTMLSILPKYASLERPAGHGHRGSINRPGHRRRVQRGRTCRVLHAVRPL